MTKTLPKSTKNLIIGGGLSGLTLAYFLEKDYLVVEKEFSFGGYCRTVDNKDYVWDYAGHFYHFQTEEFKRLFTSLVEPEEIVHQKKVTKIYYKDKLIDYPFQTNIHELEKTEFIDCLYDLFFRAEKEEYDSFLDMLYGKFGKSIVEKFLKPYNEKLYATNLGNLDKDAMGRFFPYADIEAVIQNMKKLSEKSYNDTFLYLKRGTGYFIDKLASQLNEKNIIADCPVASINSEEKYAVMADSQRIYYENLINTAPLNNFLSMTGLDNSLLKELSYNKVLVLNLGFDRPSPRYKKEHWVYYPDKELNFYRVGFYNNILGTDKLSLYVEIGFSKDQEVSADAQLALTLDNLKKVGIISDDMRLVDKNVILMDPAYVHIETETNSAVHRLIADMEKNNIYTLGRYGKWTYSSMEDCMIWARDLSKLLGD